MRKIEKISELRKWVKQTKEEGKEVGFVPTMGYLHEGHLSLVEAAKKDEQAVVMSIFVNPLQFGPNEDFDSYPRDFDRDAGLAQEAGVDVIFYPDVKEMYPEYPLPTTVQVEGITNVLCGASRPGHFTGVSTVVTKLFNIVQPDHAYFGQKDYQQVQVIKRMVRDLNMPVEVVMVPIKREEDGLAMSSRNTYLSAEERNQGLTLSQSLKRCKEMVTNGETTVEVLIDKMKEHILFNAPAAQIDYIEIADGESLAPVERIERPVVVALAVKFGKTRLIDNMVLN